MAATLTPRTPEETGERQSDRFAHGGQDEDRRNRGIGVKLEGDREEREQRPAGELETPEEGQAREGKHAASVGEEPVAARLGTGFCRT